MKTKIPSLIIAGLFLISCGQTSDHSSDAENQTVHEEHDHNNDSEAIQLNNGEKWEVNAEMLPPIQNMERQINAFTDSDQKDYNSLALGLQNDINDLTSSCTMTGQGHDELHKWLLPFIELVNDMLEAETEEEVAHVFENIQTSMITYNQHFN